jgi:hypothetical protein
VTGEPFVNSVNFMFNTVLGLVEHGEKTPHIGVIVVVFFAELVDYRDKDSTDRRNGSNDDACGGHVHFKSVSP